MRHGKKLTVRKETLRRLDAGQLRRVAGGMWVDEGGGGDEYAGSYRGVVISGGDGQRHEQNTNVSILA
jgi:hypothetical protein